VRPPGMRTNKLDLGFSELEREGRLVSLLALAAILYEFSIHVMMDDVLFRMDDEDECDIRR